MRLLSPRDSQITSKTSCRCRWYCAGDTTELKKVLDEDRVCYVVSVSSWSVVEPSWGDRGSVALGVVFFYFGSIGGPCLYLDAVMLYSCIVWSGDCKPTMYLLFPYLLHGCCEDYLTCDIAFNAVMPLSRASTRGRYSRIEGVTSSYLQRSIWLSLTRRLS